MNVRPQGLTIDGAGRSVAYRVLRESLSNVVRHARARQVTVDLASDGRVLEMSVIDDNMKAQEERIAKERQILAVLARSSCMVT